MGKSEFVGVDGCPYGWFSVGFDLRGRYELKVFPAFSELLDYYAEAKLVLVDIPIGLMEGPGGRKCDDEARRLLGPRRSSVFPAPTRQAVRQSAESPRDHGVANKIERRLAGKGMSIQAFGIAPKIHQVDEVMQNLDANASPVREVHPEICFWALNNRQPMEHSKKKREGEAERIRVLQRGEPRTQEIFDDTCRKFLRRQAARDDILDALVAAVTARFGYGRLRTIPGCPPVDCKGLPMEMVYWEAPSYPLSRERERG